MWIRLHFKHSCVHHTFNVNAAMPMCPASGPCFWGRVPLTLEFTDWPDWWSCEPSGSSCLCLSHLWGYRCVLHAQCVCLNVCEYKCMRRCILTCPYVCRCLPEAGGRSLPQLLSPLFTEARSLTCAQSFLLWQVLIASLFQGFLHHMSAKIMGCRRTIPYPNSSLHVYMAGVLTTEQFSQFLKLL